MAQQAADAAVAIGEGMDVVQPVMRRRHRDDPLALAEPLQPVAPLEMPHEDGDTIARGRTVTSVEVLFPRLFSEA